MPSKKSNHSQFVAALSSSLPGAGVTDSDAVVARLAAEDAGGGTTKEVCMAVRKSGIPVLLPLLYLVPEGGRIGLGCRPAVLVSKPGHCPVRRRDTVCRSLEC